MQAITLTEHLILTLCYHNLKKVKPKRSVTKALMLPLLWVTTMVYANAQTMTIYDVTFL